MLKFGSNRVAITVLMLQNSSMYSSRPKHTYYTEIHNTNESLVGAFYNGNVKTETGLADIRSYYVKRKKNQCRTETKNTVNTRQSHLDKRAESKPIVVTKKQINKFTESVVCCLCFLQFFSKGVKLKEIINQI